MSSGMPVSPAPQSPSPMARRELPGAWFIPEALAPEQAERHHHGLFHSVTAFKRASILQETSSPHPCSDSIPDSIPTPAPLSRAHRWEEPPGSPFRLPQLEPLRLPS